jgi:hypothetical protein
MDTNAAIPLTRDSTSKTGAFGTDARAWAKGSNAFANSASTFKAMMEGVTEGLTGISCSWNAMLDRESQIQMNM